MGLDKEEVNEDEYKANFKKTQNSHMSDDLVVIVAQPTIASRAGIVRVFAAYIQNDGNSSVCPSPLLGPWLDVVFVDMMALGRSPRQLPNEGMWRMNLHVGPCPLLLSFRRLTPQI
jgi:hypothetical protein